MGDDPDPHQCSDDRPDDAEWEPPADDELSDEADHRRDEQGHELTLIKSQVQMTSVDRDEWDLTQQRDQTVLLFCAESARLRSNGQTMSRHTTRFASRHGMYTLHLLMVFQCSAGEGVCRRCARMIRMTTPIRKPPTLRQGRPSANPRA